MCACVCVCVCLNITKQRMKLILSHVTTDPYVKTQKLTLNRQEKPHESHCERELCVPCLVI